MEHHYLARRQHDNAIEEGKKPIALGPNNAEVHILFGQTLMYSGLFEEAVEMCEKALRLHPYPPLYYLAIAQHAYRRIERYDKALALSEQLINRSHIEKNTQLIVWGLKGSIIALMGLDREGEAREHAAQLIKIAPGYNLVKARRFAFYKDLNYMQPDLDALRRAGIPQFPSSQ